MKGLMLPSSYHQVGQGPCAQVPCQQGERFEGVVCSHKVQLRGEIRKVHGERISQPQPNVAGRQEVAESRELGTMSVARTVS